MYYAITVNDAGIITKKHESVSEITAGTFLRTQYDVQNVTPLPGDIPIHEGSHVAEYDADWQLRPLSQRVAEGYVTVQEGYILDGEGIRPMTHEERIVAGIEEPDPDPELTATHRELSELHAWFYQYDIDVAKWYRGQRIGAPRVDIDIGSLDAEAEIKRTRICALRNEIKALEDQMAQNE